MYENAMKKKMFPSLNVINVKSSTCGSKGILRHYHYQLYPKLGMGIVLIIIIPCSFHDFKKTLPLPWYSTVKGAFNHPRYGRVYNYK